MGLDMYLHAKKYVSNYDFRAEDKPVNAAIKKALGVEHFDNDDASLNVSITVGYWRKANQIHAWFVDNCQDGRDECQESYVGHEKLTELRDLCVKALETKDAKLLEPRSGFFFGSTEVDEWYWSDLEHTVTTLNKVLDDASLKDFDIYYQSSW